MSVMGGRRVAAVGGRCPSMGDYVTGTEASGRGERRRRVPMLPTLPVLLPALFVQKHIVRGLTLGALKG